MSRQLCEPAALLVALLLAPGCASPLTVTYYSDPPGAVLYSNNQSFGRTPTTLQYQITEEARKRGYMILEGTSVQWASGARANISSLRADLSSGYNKQFIFNRPDNVPGREADVHFALELERLAIMRRQAEAQEDQAFWQRYNAIGQQYQRQQPAVRDCTSTLSGNRVNTTCY